MKVEAVQPVRRKRRWLPGLTAVLVVLVGLAMLHPRLYWGIPGWWKGEAFYQGYPSSYWRDAVQRWFAYRLPIWSKWVWLPGFEKIFGVEPMPLLDSPEALPVLLALRKEPNQQVRQYAWQTLGFCGSQAEQIIPILLNDLDDEDPQIRTWSRTTLEKLAPRASKNTTTR